MDKNYTEVLIDGTIYTLGGTEDETYLQRVAVYLNDKISKIRQQPGFSRQSAEYQALMTELNIADDYFKEQERADYLAEQKAALEKDAYSLKHELITLQMKMEHEEQELTLLRREKEEVRAEAEEARAQLAKVKAKAEEGTEQSEILQEWKQKYDAVKQELEKVKAVQAAATALNRGPHR